METRTIVTTSLNAVQRDTRMFQIGASFDRIGYRSVVVETERSLLDPEALPFSLITLPGAQPPVSAGQVPAAVPQFDVPDLLRLFRQQNRLLYESLPPADLYYLNFFTHFPAVWKACNRHGAKFIYDTQDAHWAWPAYQDLPLVYRGWLRLVERRCVHKASELVTVSDGVAELYERRYGRRPRLLRNVHDLRLDEGADIDLRRASGLGDDDFLLVVAGNDKPSDTIAEPLQAMTKLPERVHLALIGRGWERYSPEVKRLGLESRVHIFPPVVPTKVTDTIRTADAALVNIRATEVHLHALPTRFFHAVSAGLPVLYPPLPSVVALAESHELGLPIDAEDAGSIAEAVRTLSEDPELAAGYRANVQRASKELSWEVEERRLAQLAADGVGSEEIES